MCTGRVRMDFAAGLVAGSANIDFARKDPAFSSSIGVGSPSQRCQSSDSACWILVRTGRVRIDRAADLACNGRADTGSRWMMRESHGSACWILAHTHRLRIDLAAGLVAGLACNDHACLNLACLSCVAVVPQYLTCESTGPACFDRARMGLGCTKSSSPEPASTSLVYMKCQSIGHSCSSPECMGSGCAKCEKSGSASMGPTYGKCEKPSSCYPANTDSICTSPGSSFVEQTLHAAQPVPAAFALDACRWRCESRRCGGEGTWSI